MTSDIFPMLYSLHRTYTKSFIIFWSKQIFLYKFKHKSFSNIKEKENTPVPRPDSPQAGRTVQPASWPTRASCSSLPLYWSLTCGAPWSGSSSTFDRDERIWFGRASPWLRRVSCPELKHTRSPLPCAHAKVLNPCSTSPKPPRPRPWRTVAFIDAILARRGWLNMKWYACEH